MNCPLCQAELNEDFGLVHCPSCPAVLMVNIDGKVEVNEEKKDFGEEQIKEEPEELSLKEAPVEQAQALDILEKNPSSENDLASEFSEQEPLNEEKSEEEWSGEEFQKEKRREEEGKKEKSFLEQQGILGMNLTLFGIDTARMKEELREILSDEAFLWDVDEMMSSIKKGELHFENLSVTKASVLVNRIRHLGIRVHWKQKMANLSKV